MVLQPSKKLFYSSAVLIVLAITAVVIYPSDPIDFNTGIKEGAKWGNHWVYQKVKEPVVPSSSNSWIQNNVDQYIVEKLLPNI